MFSCISAKQKMLKQVKKDIYKKNGIAYNDFTM